MTPREDQFNDLEHEVLIPFDEAGEARFPRRAPDEVTLMEETP